MTTAQKAKKHSLTHDEFIAWFKKSPSEAQKWFKDYLAQEDSSFDGDIQALVELDDQCEDYDYLLVVHSNKNETRYLYMKTCKGKEIHLWSCGTADCTELIWDKKYYFNN
jgi:hypothetical protein